jgi:hypothetical protein
MANTRVSDSGIDLARKREVALGRGSVSGDATASVHGCWRVDVPDRLRGVGGPGMSGSEPVYVDHSLPADPFPRPNPRHRALEGSTSAGRYVKCRQSFEFFGDFIANLMF